jgi:hypothetical protein
VAKAVITLDVGLVEEEDTMVVDQVASTATMDQVDQVVAEVVILRLV